MTRIFSFAAALLAASISGWVPGTKLMAQEDSLDIEYAERVPLAAHSLMLDVIRSGDRIIAAGERGDIIFSDDDGATWQQAEVVPTRSTLTSLFALGGRLWAAGHDSVILTSGDGGNNWTLQNFDPERQQPIMDLYFRDSKNGLAIGAYGLMLVTSNGGQTWEDWAVNDEDDAHLNALLALPDGTWLIAGEAGFSYRSTDQGETWESLDLPYTGSMFGAVLDGHSCVVFFGLRGHVMQSCDEGDSWTELDSKTQATLLGAAMDEGRVLLVGNSGAVLELGDDGQFTYHVHPSGVDFSAAIGLGGGRFLLVGEDGSHFYPPAGTAGRQP